MTRYEDTVQPEIAPCADCGVLVDEGDVDLLELDAVGDWICGDCAGSKTIARSVRPASSSSRSRMLRPSTTVIAASGNSV